MIFYLKSHLGLDFRLWTFDFRLYSGFALMKLLPFGITNKFVLLSLTRNFQLSTIY